MRASMVISSMPTSDTRTNASITRPLSRIVSITSTRALPDDRWTDPDPSYGETVMACHLRSGVCLRVTPTRSGDGGRTCAAPVPAAPLPLPVPRPRPHGPAPAPADDAGPCGGVVPRALPPALPPALPRALPPPAHQNPLHRAPR